MHWSGQMRCRVTTLTRYWTDGSNSADLINGFDQVRAGLCVEQTICCVEHDTWQHGMAAWRMAACIQL
jgi:hypothetical protein